MSTPATGVNAVGVVGCGLMGSGIAELCAREGLDTLVYEVDAKALEAGGSRIENSLARAVERGKLTADDRDAALRRLSFTTGCADFAERDLAIEAVPEDEALKVHVFAELDKAMVRPEALIASNTSSIPVMRPAAATNRPGQVAGLHFFSPGPVLDLVELVPSLVISDSAWERLRAFVTDTLNRHVIVSQDRAGFVVKPLLIPYIVSAIRMFESGFATAQDIDEGMVRDCAIPWARYAWLTTSVWTPLSPWRSRCTPSFVSLTWLRRHCCRARCRHATSDVRPASASTRTRDDTSALHSRRPRPTTQAGSGIETAVRLPEAP